MKIEKNIQTQTEEFRQEPTMHDETEEGLPKVVKKNQP